MKLRQGMRQKENGSIEYRFMVDGKRHSVCAKSVKEVLQKEQEMRLRIASGYKCNTTLTLDDYFTEWIRHRSTFVKPATINSYTSYYKNWIGPALGDSVISKMEKRQIANAVEKISKDGSVYVANFSLNLIKTILNDAISDDVITVSPAASIKSFKDNKEKATDTIHRALTKEETNVLFDALKPEWLYEAFCLMINTGMRAGEISSLRWSDIGNDMIHIVRTSTLSADGHRITGPAKTSTSVRDIPINESIRKILHDQKVKSESVLKYGPNTNVFYSVTGVEITPDTLNYVLERVIKKMNKNGVSFDMIGSHAMRDTFATRFLEQTGDLKTLQKILGHSTFNMTADLYAHVLPDTKREKMEKLQITV